MKIFAFYLIILLLVAFSIPGFGAKPFLWKIDFQKSENYLIQGDYKNALKKNTLFLLHLKSSSAGMIAEGAAWFQLARIYNGLGDFNQQDIALAKGLTFLQNKSVQEQTEYAFLLGECLKTYLEKGDLKAAQEWAEAGESHLSSNSATDLFSLTKFRLENAKVLYEQGFLNKALEQLPALEKVLLSRIVKKESQKDLVTGKEKLVKVTSEELDSRKRAYAEALHLHIRVLASNGFTRQADSLQKSTEVYIRSALGKKDFSIVEALFVKGKVQEHLFEDKEAYVAYTSALDLYATSKGLHYTHYGKDAGRLFQTAILMEEQIGKGKEGSKDQTSYDSKIKRYYGKKNFYFSQTYLLDAEKKFLSGDLKEAKELLIELQQKKLIPETHPENIRLMHDLFKVHLAEEDYKTAESELRAIIPLHELVDGPEAPVTVVARLELADFLCRFTGKFREAGTLFAGNYENLENAVNILSPDFMQQCFNKIYCHQVLADHDLAESSIEKLISEVEKQKGITSIEYNMALMAMSSVVASQGDLSASEKMLQKILSFYESREIHSPLLYKHVVNAQLSLAALLIAEGQYSEAGKSIRKAQKLSKDAVDLVFCRNDIGIEESVALFTHTGKYQEASHLLHTYMEAKQKRAAYYNQDLIRMHQLQASLDIITGDFGCAQQEIRKSEAYILPLFGDTSLQFSELLKITGKVNVAMGDYGQAEKNLSKVLELQKRKLGTAHPLLAATLNDLALAIFYHQANTGATEALLVNALDMLRNSGQEQTTAFAEVRKNLALVYLETGKEAASEKMLNELHAFWVGKLGKENIHSSDILSLQGILFAHLKKYKEAKQKFALAKESYASMFDSYHPQYVKALSRSAQMSFILGDEREAVKSMNEVTSIYLKFITNYFPSLSEREKTKFWGLMKNDFEFYNNLAVSQYGSDPSLLAKAYNLNLITKSLLLNSSIKTKQNILSSKDTTLINRYNGWIEKKELLVSAISMSMEERKANQIDIAELEKKIEMLEKDLSSSSGIFVSDRSKESVYTWEKIRDNLKNNEYAIEVLRYRKFNTSFSDTIVYAAMLVSPQSKNHPELITLDDGNGLENKYFKYYKNCIRLQTSDNKSFDHYWKPFQKYLPKGSTIYFSPDGVFSQLNLEAIQSSDDQYLIDEYNFVLLGSTRDLVAKEKNSKNKNLETLPTKVALLGNPTYYPTKQLHDVSGSFSSKRSVAQLPGAATEVKALYHLLQSSTWQPELYLEQEAKEEVVKNLKNPKVFHIATHGFFMEEEKINGGQMDELSDNSFKNPLLRSGLLLTNGGNLLESDNVYNFNSEDGILTAYEAMNLSLDQTDLVVLSACESGLGEIQEGEGVYGLQRAFQMAGAKSVIMSLFKVSDQVTEELMYSFYQKWVKTGDKRAAFTLAKKEIKLKYPDPLNWAAFVMVGKN